MNFRILICMFLHYLQSAKCTDIFTKDFQLFSKDICKSGCSKIRCYANTLISIESIQNKPNSEDSKCNEINPTYSISPYNCHFKFIENHILKTCSNVESCQLCLNKIESDFLPNTLCTSENDLTIKYRCIPGYIKIENVCSDSYLDIDCPDRLNEKLIVLNATLYPEIKSTSEDPRGCNRDNSSKNRVRCRQVDKTHHAISQCSYRGKCSIGPNKFTPSNCGNMHMRLSYACVPEPALYNHNPASNGKSQSSITQIPLTDDSESSGIKKHKWTILGISVTILVFVSLIISLLVCFNRRSQRQRSCDISTIPKENLFSKLGQQKFTPPPSSIDKVNIEFENATLAPPDIYNCHSDTEDSNVRSIYSSNIPNTLSYSTQFCKQPPSINTCQYFAPMLSPGHISMLDMPAIRLASSGNLTSSTINSSHGTPRGTKSSGIFSMTDMSFENAHLV